MTVTLKSVHKAAVIGWDTNEVLGDQASLQVEEGGEYVEKRIVENDGESNLFFPMDYTGTVNVKVVGSKEGESSGTISVP